MNLGDFTKLATAYVHRPGYSPTVLQALIRYVGATSEGFRVADVGAGTGKLTQMLAAFGLKGHAVEPNAAMRSEGIAQQKEMLEFSWHAGCAEETTLPSSSVDWVVMASSFHWTHKRRALAEFRRILRPAGYLTVMWNPRDLDGDPLQAAVDAKIHTMVPELRRHSSGAARHTLTIEDDLQQDHLFGDVLFNEAPHELRMSTERYLGVWNSVNDIRAQAGEVIWSQIESMIRSEIEGLEEVCVRYRTRAWTVRAMES